LFFSTRCFFIDFSFLSFPPNLPPKIPSNLPAKNAGAMFGGVTVVHGPDGPRKTLLLLQQRRTVSPHSPVCWDL